MGADETVNRDTAKLWGKFHEINGLIQTLVARFEGKIDGIELLITGPDGQNGVRGELKDLRKRLEHFEVEVRESDEHALQEIRRIEAWGKETVNDLWHNQRPLNCIGKKALDDHMKREEGEMESLALEIRSIMTKLDEREGQRRKERAQVVAAAIAVFGSVLVSAATAFSSIMVARIENEKEADASRYPESSIGTNYQSSGWDKLEVKPKE